MLTDRQEYPCQVVNMSPGGMALIGPVIGRQGERVVAYIDHLGRLEGLITRHFDNGFAMTIAATLRKRDMIAAQLTWLANRHLLASPEDRRHGRFVPKNPMTMLILPNGINLGCRLIDLSLSGAAVATDQRPAMGTLVTLGKVQGRVVRHLEERLRGRVHAHAASRLCRGERHRRVNAVVTIAVIFRIPDASPRRFFAVAARIRARVMLG